jgi:hypothetical protein
VHLEFEQKSSSDILSMLDKFMIFENLKKRSCSCKCCVVVYLPTNFEKDWPTLLPDCFAWFSQGTLYGQSLNGPISLSSKDR